MLQVWLPLNGNIKNQGLSNYTIDAVRGSIVYNDSGKIGKCFYAHGVNTLRINNIIPDFYNYSSYSLCAWLYIEAQNTTHSGSAVISAGDWNAQVLNLALGDWSTDHYTTLRISGTSWSRNYAYNFFANQWYHVVVSSDGTSTKAYVNGVLINDTAPGFLPTSIKGNDIYIGGASYYSGMQFFGRINDVRIYDHALSEKEVQEIAKGLVVHYKLDNNGLGGENLFIGSSYTSSDITNFVGIGDTDWTKPLRYYNGSKNIHSFADGIDTITLTSTSNLGIAFVRSAADINLDTNSQYTISCEAQCSSISKPLCIGLSYYTTANTWTWRGGTNGQNFKAIDTWQKFTLTFTPDANTQYICYCFTVATGGNNILKIRNCKLEKGSIATSWSPAPEEVGTNNTIYDCSGYQNNATPIGILTASTDTAKYSVATKFINTSYIRSLGRPNDFLPHDAITVNLWMKCTTWGNPISCTESGGFNFKANGDYIYFPIHITHSGSNNYAGARTSITRASLLNNWHMITGVYDGTNTIIYVDGEESGRNTSQYSGTIHYQNNYLFIGAEAQGDDTTPANSAFVGNISDVRIYATALSAAAIKDLYETSAEIDKNGNFYAREIIEL